MEVLIIPDPFDPLRPRPKEFDLRLAGLALHFENVIIPEGARRALVLRSCVGHAKLLRILALLLIQIVFHLESSLIQG